LSGQLKILVVDDDFIVRDIVSEILESTGKYQAIQAEDGEEALACFTSDPAIRLVISDVNMPKMDGYALLTEIRKTGSRTPVLMLTGFSAPDTGATIQALGATDFMAKDDSFQETILPWVEKTLG
jgi:CheY-like chemotaxis protein